MTRTDRNRQVSSPTASQSATAAAAGDDDTVATSWSHYALFYVARNVFYVLGVLLLVHWVATSAAVFSPYYETCQFNPYHREANPDKLHIALVPVWIRELTSFTIVRLVLVVLILLNTVQAATRRLKVVTFVLFTGHSLLYFPILELVEYLKETLGDAACVTESSYSSYNSVSGHLYFFVWSICTVLYWVVSYHRFSSTAGTQPGSSSKWVWLLLLYTVVADAFNIYCTYTYGYHSLRQMALGAMFGLGYSALCILLWESLILLLGKPFATTNHHDK